MDVLAGKHDSQILTVPALTPRDDIHLVEQVEYYYVL